MRYRKAARIVLPLLVFAAVSLFFLSEFRKNWASIESFHVAFEPSLAALAFAALSLTSLLTTYGWFLTLNALSGRRIGFPESIAAVNTSNLTKYVPGKVWSYALQMYWLTDAGYSKSLVLYVNLINVYVSLMTSLLLGAACMVLLPSGYPLSATGAAFAALLVCDVLFVRYHSTLARALISYVNRVLKRDIGYFEPSAGLLLHLHLNYFVAAFCFGAGAYLLCLGIGLDVTRTGLLPVMAAMTISDVLGFLAVIVPGGLGVREGAMYVILRGASSATLSLVLPIAARIATMLVDMSLGLTGIILLRRLRHAGERGERAGGNGR